MNYCSKTTETLHLCNSSFLQYRVQFRPLQKTCCSSGAANFPAAHKNHMRLLDRCIRRTRFQNQNSHKRGLSFMSTVNQYFGIHPRKNQFFQRAAGDIPGKEQLLYSNPPCHCSPKSSQSPSILIFMSFYSSSNILYSTLRSRDYGLVHRGWTSLAD